MILLRVFFVLIAVAAAPAARAAPTPQPCARTNTSARVEALISPQIQNTGSGSFCDATPAFAQHIRPKSENALAPDIVRNPFLPAERDPARRRATALWKSEGQCRPGTDAASGSMKLVAERLPSDRPRDLFSGLPRSGLQLRPEFVAHLVDRGDDRPRRQPKPDERCLG